MVTHEEVDQGQEWGGQNFTANPLILSDFLNNVNVKAIHKIKFKEK